MRKVCKTVCMNMNRTATLRLIRLSTILFISFIIIIYAISRCLIYIHVPQIEIFQPVNGSAISSTTVTIIGRADRVNSLTLNGKTVFIDQSGNFTDTILVFPGVNIITLQAEDQFGRSIDDRLELVGTL